MLNISEQSLDGIVFIIDGDKLLAIFQQALKEPPQAAHLRKFDEIQQRGCGRSNQQFFL